MRKSSIKKAVNTASSMQSSFADYSSRLQQLLTVMPLPDVEVLCHEIVECARHKKNIFICGNGGSAGNAIHLANDFIYGAGGLRAEALSANSAVLTCLANDISYEHIYSQQLLVKADHGDLLIVLSGSGNSPNIVKAIEAAKSLGMITAAIVGYDGGKCKSMVNVAVHTELNDMQIAEDMQLVVGHMMMQWLSTNLSADALVNPSSQKAIR